ncbi:MAG: hypothetical protein Ct9H300mP13_6270 [Gammaproteobacteria bacterium]|nr:MAG: hypothetical protein Ct9H300mP13_6270 [Gammaproteobacteria bacterium]
MSRLAQALSQPEFVVTSELIPPKGIDLEPLFMKADALHQVVTAFNLTESHTAKMSMDPVAVGHLLLDRGIEPIVQMTSRDKNPIAIQASMLGAAALGFQTSLSWVVIRLRMAIILKRKGYLIFTHHKSSMQPVRSMPVPITWGIY